MDVGLKRLDDGALKKEYEGAAKEVEFAVQMTLDKVISEDPRFLERPAPKLDEEFPDRSNVFFLGEHAYGTAAQVSSTANNSLSVVLAVRVPFLLRCVSSAWADLSSANGWGEER